MRESKVLTYRGREKLLKHIFVCGAAGKIATEWGRPLSPRVEQNSFGNRTFVETGGSVPENAAAHEGDKSPSRRRRVLPLIFGLPRVCRLESEVPKILHVL